MMRERWPDGDEDNQFVDYYGILPPNLMDDGRARELMRQRLLGEAEYIPDDPQSGLTLAGIEHLSARLPHESWPDASGQPDDTGGQFAAPPPEGRNFYVAREGVPERDIGQLEAARIGLRSGLSANLYDEGSGLHAAARAGLGLPEGTRTSAVFTPLMGLAMLGYEYLTGTRGEATKAYEAARDKARDEYRRAEEQYPLTTEVSNEVGGLLLPGGAAKRGATVGQNLWRGVRAGTMTGGLSGVGEGTDAESRMSRGAEGAFVGGLKGGAITGSVDRTMHRRWR